MEKVVIFIAMVCMLVFRAGTTIANKEAVVTGMDNYTFIFYSNALASLVLLPLCFLVQRSRPPLTASIVFECSLQGLVICLCSLAGYEGLKYSPASFSAVMQNLIPGFVFVFVVILRLEKVNFKSSSTLAKAIGTTVSIIGAVAATLYQGPQLINLSSNSLHQLKLYVPEMNIVLGGSLITLQCVLFSIFAILQARIVKKYPAEVIILFICCCSTSIISLALCFVLEGNRISWSLQPTSRLLAVLYAGIGTPLSLGMGLWCVRKKGILFVTAYSPLTTLVAAILAFILFGEPFFLGTLLGSIVIIIGLYCFLWGKAREEIVLNEELSSSELGPGRVPLLKNKA